MDKKSVCYTTTLGSLYQSQGYFSKAAEIYRYLLNRNPQDQKISALLNEVQKQLAHQNIKATDGLPDELIQRISEWVRLSLLYQRRQHLDRVMRRIK